MTTTTKNRLLLNSDRHDAKMVLKWAEWAAANGGSFEVRNLFTDSNWFSDITIHWPEGKTEKDVQ